ncbi:hypothetical protein RN50_00032 [Microbacterium foliorum]|uniref:Uncharacterized protein n=1 Tax=Microbacterium foliorum TaxID=104336 RepID=A0A0F0L2R6_9MICO|nr:hypothetical protein RN50_00032 [Microbacterium foliorum]
MCLEIGDEGIRDLLRPAARVHPAAGVGLGGEQQAGCCSGEGGERRRRMRQHASDQCGGLFGAERARGQGGALVEHPQGEAQSGQRLAGHPQHLIPGEVRDALDVRAERAQESQPRALVDPERGCGALDVAPRDARSAAVERVRVRDVRMDPLDAFGQTERLEERGGDGGGVHGRAHVVPETGERRVEGAETAADGVGGFEDPHLVSRAGEGHGRREAVRSGADDRRACHTASLPRPDVRSLKR